MEPTRWETEEIESIDELLKKCQLRGIAFSIQERDRDIIETTPSTRLVAKRLRYFVTDLYSVLDYLCYLLYCHFKNNGERSESRETRNVTFPYKNLCRSTHQGQEASFEKERNEFLSRESNILGLAGEKAVEYQNLIRDCQIITDYQGDDGSTPVEPQPPPTNNALVFNTLHYLRNCSIHRHLVYPRVEPGWLYHNRQDGSWELVADQMLERDNDSDNWESREVSSAYWIESPPLGNGEGLKPLISVASDLLNFVVNTREILLNLIFPGQFPWNNRVHYNFADRVISIGNDDYSEEEISLNESDLWAV